jgi:hypothetical protein
MRTLRSGGDPMVDSGIVSENTKAYHGPTVEQPSPGLLPAVV